jgi:outer membrane lipoprotein carrier protein LolA
MKRHAVASGFTAGWLAFASTLSAAAPVAKIQSMIARPKVLCGRFDQTKQLVGLKKPLASNGRFCVVADKGVLWRSLQPFPSTLRLTRDEIVQMQGGRVAMRLDAKQEPAVRMINGVLFAALAGDLEKLEALFEIDGGVRDAHQWTVTLKAREPALAKAIGSIALEGGAYVQNVRIDEAGGDRTSIVFSDIRTGDGAMSADEAAQF